MSAAFHHAGGRDDRARFPVYPTDLLRLNDPVKEVACELRAREGLRRVAEHLEAVTFKLDEARPLIEAQQSDETPQALEQHDIVRAQVTAQKAYCDKLNEGCRSFAESLEHTKNEIKKAVVELLALIGVDQAFGWGFAWLTGGGSAEAAQGGMALALSIYGARIAATIRALAILAESAKVRVAASQLIARGTELLGPLLRARPALAGAPETATVEGAPLFQNFMALRRPKLTPESQKQITDRTKTWGPKGSKTDDFYTDVVEPHIKVPIEKNYDNNKWIEQLEKTPDGRYYIDKANDAYYPVNPNWEFGHATGFEHRKIVAEAQAKGMNQEQFSQWVNQNQDKFYVQDWYHNRSHRSEEK